LVLSPVILEPHAIGTLGNSGGQNSSLHSFNFQLYFQSNPSLGRQ
jgi:hypothetical protein